MSYLVEECPRCGAKHMTFDVRHALPTSIQYSWQYWYELFCVCRHCLRSTTFVVNQKRSEDKDLFASGGKALVGFEAALNDYLKVQGYVSLRDKVTHAPPEHIPLSIRDAFREGATCLAVQCWNAAATMFRMCVDLATRPMIPAGETDGPNPKTRRDLGLRLRCCSRMTACL